MLQVTENEIKNRLRFDSPWWERPSDLDLLLEGLRERAYLDPFFNLVSNRGVNRAVVLMGPRRVGKTVILRQSIRRLLNAGVEPNRIFFVSLDNPIYTGLPLAKMLGFFQEMHGHDRFADLYVFFDEIQYLRDWEIHLKVLVDDFPNMRFVVSGSAAAALKMKSDESGAGRFTDFLLPPLTFAEFLDFRGVGKDVEIEQLNEELFAYINFGGFPEAVLKDSIRDDFQRFVGSDIIDKVLLRDIPSLYGIADPQELNRFFATLAYNTGNEISIDELSKKSGVAKNTIRKYLEFLEAAFLIHRLHRVDRTAKRFQRESHFKVYLTNPCLRSALFGPVEQDDEKAGYLVETAVVAQYVPQEDVEAFHYARWDKGEVDLILLGNGFAFPIEIKWQKSISDRDINGINKFNGANNNSTGLLLTRYLLKPNAFDKCMDIPVSAFCRSVGYQFLDSLQKGIRPRRLLPDLENLEREGPSPSQ